ncbi:MAG: HNH endonuclease [Sulfuritalea sp.]|nr:HNH endonuclease [Sulfuritalea sp.]MBP6422505.1 HNH endonuclease [Propionivibrio sp.]
MKYWVGVTDNHWFNFLANQGFDEANFWQPSIKPPFTNSPVGMPFLFKLKRPYNHIAGGGFYVGFSTLPISLAWDCFGPKNGAASLEELQEMLEPLFSKHSQHDEIGCTVLSNTVFLPEPFWISDPPGWSSNIVRGKMYESADPDGKAIWTQIQERLKFSESEPESSVDGSVLGIKEPPSKKYGEPVLVKPRLGQSSFRVLVTDAYKRKCAITGESTLIALEAAHIVPYSKDGSHDVSNGLLLRADFHRLFDVGLVSVTPELKVRVSPRIREAWFNGKAYYRLDNQPLEVLPERPALQPDRDRLEWHYKTLFQA